MEIWLKKNMTTLLIIYNLVFGMSYFMSSFWHMFHNPKFFGSWRLLDDFKILNTNVWIAYRFRIIGSLGWILTHLSGICLITQSFWKLMVVRYLKILNRTTPRSGVVYQCVNWVQFQKWEVLFNELEKRTKNLKGFERVLKMNWRVPSSFWSGTHFTHW